MGKIEQIREAIANALERKSKLTEGVIDSVGGFISPNNRHLYNNLGAISTHYGEVGSHLGASSISSVYGNYNLKSAVMCDLFCEFNNDGETKNTFLKNCNRFIPNQYKLVEKDCFSVTKEDFPNPIDYYLFDGPHDPESQYRAITYFKRFMANECIVVIDDFGWNNVSIPTLNGIKEAELKILYQQFLFSGVEGDCGDKGWWGGLGVFLLKK